MSWAQVPHDDPPRSSFPTVAWGLATIPLLVGFASPTSLRWWVHWAVPLMVVHAVVLGLARRWPRSLVPLALVGAAGLGVAWGPPSGVLVAAVGAMGLVLWSWGTASTPPPLGWLPSAPRLSLLAAAIATALLVVGQVVLGALVLLAGLVLLAAIAVAPASMERIGDRLEPLDRWARSLAAALYTCVAWLADRLRSIVGGVAMVPVLIVVSTAWALQRIARHDPLRAPSGRDSTWTTRRAHDHQPLRSFSGAALVDDRPIGARASRLIASGLALALLVGAVAVTARDRGSGPVERPSPEASTPASMTTSLPATGDCSTPPSEPILAAQPQAVALSCDRLAVFAHAQYRVASGVRLADYEGETINIMDGERRTWLPPPCSCRRLTVWWLGGSAGWGEGQRDLYTLPSMLAKAAWANGVALDIRNFAIPTYTFNQEVHRLAELTTSDPPPDLIVSYGGGNDLVFQALRASRGRASDDSDIALLEQTFDDVVRHGIPVDPSEIEWTPDPQQVDGTASAAQKAEVVAATLARYRRNLGLAERLARSIDRPLAVAWQPLLAGSSDRAGETGLVPAGLLRTFSEMERSVRDGLPSEVLDLGGTFESIDHPVFFDLFHTGEEGAAIVAGALYDALKPAIDRARSQAEETGQGG